MKAKVHIHTYIHTERDTERNRVCGSTHIADKRAEFLLQRFDVARHVLSLGAKRVDELLERVDAVGALRLHFLQLRLQCVVYGLV